MERFIALVRSISARRKAFRIPLLLIAIIGFSVGCLLSMRELDVSSSDLHLLPLLVLALILVPLTIAYSAVNVTLMGKAAQVEIGFMAGVRVSIYAQVAELLPIPGGAIVRTAALVQAGSNTLHSARLVLTFGLLWITCAACGAGIALANVGWPAYALAGGGSIGTALTYLWLARRFGRSIASSAVLLRLGGLMLVATRLVVAFAAIGIHIPWSASWAFSFATILGSAASLVPAGLGVGEGLSALIAVPMGILPAAAFLAAALNRLIGYIVHLLACGIMIFRDAQSRTIRCENTNAIH